MTVAKQHSFFFKSPICQDTSGITASFNIPRLFFLFSYKVKIGVDIKLQTLTELIELSYAKKLPLRLKDSEYSHSSAMANIFIFFNDFIFFRK